MQQLNHRNSLVGRSGYSHIFPWLNAIEKWRYVRVSRTGGRKTAFFISLLACAAAGAAGETLVERGEYLVRAAGCVACHTDIDGDGAYLAGGRSLATPFGTFYSPNITPDPEHGIGSWSEDAFAGALKRGEGPQGKHYYPVFPFTAYSAMRRDDVAALFAYLRTVPAVAQADLPHDLPWPMRWRFVNRVWKWLFFEPRETPDERGAYLVSALGHCDECHTPRNHFGALDYTRHLIGNPHGPEGDPVPNITPHRKSGIGRWGRSDLVRYLRNGMLPDGDFAGGVMVEVIDEGLSYLEPADIEAIADYLRSLEPVQSK